MINQNYESKEDIREKLIRFLEYPKSVQELVLFARRDSQILDEFQLLIKDNNLLIDIETQGIRKWKVNNE